MRWYKRLIWAFLVLRVFFLWETVVNNCTFVNYTICLERLQWYFIVISSHFYQTFKESHLMLKMKRVAIEKKFFLKDARHSGHQMRTVVCSNLSFSSERCWKSSPQWGSSKSQFIKLLFAMQMWKPTLSVFTPVLLCSVESRRALETHS